MLPMMMNSNTELQGNRTFAGNALALNLIAQSQNAKGSAGSSPGPDVRISKAKKSIPKSKSNLNETAAERPMNEDGEYAGAEFQRNGSM